MGVRVVIGTGERDLKDIDSNWINEQIDRRKREGVPVCVRVKINEGDINLSLATPDCGSGPGTPRRLTKMEREVINLWSKLHLNQSDFTGGNLIAFLKQFGG